MTIDYSKLNDRIVKQAYYSLSDEQKQKLIQNKIERAKVLLASQRKEAVYFQIED